MNISDIRTFQNTLKWFELLQNEMLRNEAHEKATDPHMKKALLYTTLVDFQC